MLNNSKISTKDALAEALILVDSPKLMEKFLIDLCTPAELRALSERWHVAQLWSPAF